MFIFFVVGAAALTCAAGAEAAQRYVAPTGSGAACTQVAPCSIDQGVNSAGAGDEVIVASGTYNPGDLVSANGLSIHGVAGQPRPVINSSANAAFNLSGAITNVRDLTIHHTGTFTGLAVLSTSGTIERVDVRSSGFEACSIGLDILMRDSICAATNPNGTALSRDFSGGTTTMKLRNVTAIATGTSSKGIFVSATSSGYNAVDAKNVIVQGGLYDIQTQRTAPVDFASVVLTNSNYDVISAGPGTSITAPGTGTNQTGAPLFVDAGAGDYRQAPGSPTVDAGTTDPDLGLADLDGDARTLGSAPDIGADELVPAVTPPPPGDTTPPETTISKGPRAKTKSKKATFRFSSSESGSTFVCALDGNVARPCVSPLKLTRVTKGKHKLTVVATDAAGNADATPASYKWKVNKKRKKR